MSRIPLPWLVVSLLVIALVAFWDKSPNDLLNEEPDRASNFPQAYMTDIELREYDTEGQLRNIMTTQAAEYFQVDPARQSTQDYTLIDRPRMIFNSTAGNAPWSVTAQQGRIGQDGVAMLTTDVRVYQDSPKQGLIEILTSELLIKTAEQYAETDKAVKMRAQQGHLDTIGMKAFLSEDRIELLSQVRGTYEPR
jgi:lipopolysaccharide export system protein LptC